MKARILTFLADNWLLLTFPAMCIAYPLSVADALFGWSPAHLPLHFGYWLGGCIGVFWVFAPDVFRKYRTKIT